MSDTQKRNWKDVIKPYLEYYDDYFSNEENVKHHILFVEGYGDCVYYNGFFNDVKKHKYNYEIRKRDILFDFTNKFSSVEGRLPVNEFGRFEDFENEDESEKQNQLNVTANTEVDNKRNELFNIFREHNFDNEGYDNFSFVIKCMDELTRNKYDHLDCFGIIDLDSNQHTKEIEENNILNIVQSKCHDRETTLVRCGLLNYLNSISQQSNFDQIKEKIKSTLMFTVKQGIMERASFEYENKNGKTKILNKFTHSYIKDKASRKDYSSFSFNNYKSDYFATHLPYTKHDEESNLDITIDPEGEYERIKEDFENNYLLEQIDVINKECFVYALELEEEKTIDTQETVLNNYLSTAIDEFFKGSIVYDEVVDTLFKYTNGHIFLGQLLYKNDETELFKDVDGNVILPTDRDGENKLVEVLFDINRKDNIDSAFSCAPLKEYSHFRDEIRIAKEEQVNKER